MAGPFLNIQTKPLVILPTYNERENIQPFAAEILSAVQTDILIVDDRSPDGTGEIAERMSKENSSIHVLRRAGKMGLGSAYVTGFKWALERNYDPIIQMDSDFSHDPKELPRLMEQIKEADLVIGSRYVEGGFIKNWPRRRLWVSRFGSFYSSTILNVNVRDLTGGFKVFRRKVIQALNLNGILSDGYAFQIETTYKTIQNGFKVKEVPIVFKDRTRGKSKISRKVVWEAVWMPWKLRMGF